MKKIVLAIVFIFLGIILYKLIINNDEGMWICDKDAWVMQGNPTYLKPVRSCGKPISLPKNKDDCLKIGGIWEKQGPDPFESCDRKTIDRGNLCRDNSECEGTCQVELTREEIRQGMSGRLDIDKKYGQCSVWVTELGCQGIMKNGKAHVICID